MSTTPLARGEGTETALPLVAVVCSVPMIFEALREQLGAFADVQSFPARNGTAGLLRSIRPAAVVVDSDEDVTAAEPVARELHIPLVYLSLADRCVRSLRDGAWTVTDDGQGVRAETVRDLVAAAVFAKGQA